MHDDIYQIYLEELAAYPDAREQESELLARIKNGDETARKQLIEGTLAYGVELAKPYADRGVPLGDLVQEANLILMLSLDEYESGDFRLFLKPQIEAALQQAVDEQTKEKNVEEETLARVNVLSRISKMMAEELGREATVEELAQRMKMTSDEIRGIMKLTLDAMSVSSNIEV